MMTSVTQEMLKKCQSGDETSWRELFYAIYPLSKWVVSHTLYLNVTSTVIEEIAQDTMITLASNINSITDEKHLKRYVKMVTRNKCIDYYRQHKEFEELPEDILAQENPALDDNVVDTLHEAVKELKKPCNTIVRYRYLLDMSYKDISQKAGIDVGQIGVRLNRCLGFVKDFLQSKNISWEDVI